MGVIMISGGITLLTVAGTIYTAYEAYHASDRQMVVLSAAGGLIFSIFLQAQAGKFSNKETSLGTRMVRVLVRDYFSSVLSSAILPFAVVYGYVKRSGETINKKSFGFIQIDQAITIRGRDVSHLYPALVGANFGFLAGQMVGRLISHIFKA
jgi:hypothetical protein